MEAQFAELAANPDIIVATPGVSTLWKDKPCPAPHELEILCMSFILKSPCAVHLQCCMHQFVHCMTLHLVCSAVTCGSKHYSHPAGIMVTWDHWIHLLKHCPVSSNVLDMSMHMHNVIYPNMQEWSRQLTDVMHLLKLVRTLQ